jgi:hypothetical protein
LRIPGQVVVDDQGAELEVDAFGPGLGGDHDRSLLAKMVDQSGAGIGCPGTCDAVGPRMPGQPILVDLAGVGVAVGTVEQHDSVAVGRFAQEREQVILGAPGFGEDKCLARGAEPGKLCEGPTQRGYKGLSPGVIANPCRQELVATQLGDLFADGFAVLLVNQIRRGLRLPLLELFVQGLVVQIQAFNEIDLRVSLVEQTLQARRHRTQRAADGVGGGRQQLPEHEGDQLSLAVGQGLEIGPAKIVCHEGAQLLLVLAGCEFLDDGDALRVGDGVSHLFAQCAFAQGGDAAAKLLEGLLVIDARELTAKAVQVTEDPPVDDADQPVQLQQGVLQRRSGQKDLGMDIGEPVPQRVGDNVAGLVDISQTVRLVVDDEVPANPTHIVDLRLCELVGADNGSVVLEGVVDALLSPLIAALGFENDGFEGKLVLQLLIPLLAQVGRDDDQNSAAAFGPKLREHEASFDGLSQADLVGQDNTTGQGVPAGKQRRFDLMRIQIDLGIDQGVAKRLDGIPGRAPGQLPGEELALVVGVFRNDFHSASRGLGG